MNFETERLILREWRKEDAPCILKLNSNPDVLKYLRIPPWPRPMNCTKAVIEGGDRMKRMLKHHLRIVLITGDELNGCALTFFASRSRGLTFHEA